MNDGLDLRHDVQDAQLVDRNGENIGRCDILTLELREGMPPRVAAILIGGPARHERIGRWMTGLARLFGGAGKDDRGLSRIPFGAMRSIGETLQLDVLRHELPSEKVEQWLATHFICRIPGAHEKKERRK